MMNKIVYTNRQPLRAIQTTHLLCPCVELIG
jgi:hypothetical protein